MAKIRLPNIHVPDDMRLEEMPDLLRYWYLGTKARRHMVLRRFHEVDVELPQPLQGPVLDIGSAWGYNVMALSALGVMTIGMDLVAEQFPTGARIAAANDVPFRVLGGDAAALPFGDGVFRSVTMVETFEHIFEADRLGVLQECHRVLRPGGRLVLSTPNYSSLVERFKRLAVRHPSLQRRLPTMCYPADGISRTAYHPYQYHRPWSAPEIRSELEQAGFTVHRVKYFLFAMKNTPDALFRLFETGERIAERTPLLRRLAATLCIVADK